MPKIPVPSGRRYEATYPVKIGQVIIDLLQQIIVLMHEIQREVKRGNS